MTSEKLSQFAIARYLSGEYDPNPMVAADAIAKDLGHRRGSTGHAIVGLTLKNHRPADAQFCGKCSGTGTFKGPHKTGLCYTCRGKGYTTEADRGRSVNYWVYRAVKEMEDEF